MMKFKNLTAYYALFIGICMILMWVFFIVSGNVPEFEVKPWEIVYHLIAEFATALLLVVAGILTLKKHRLDKPLLLTGFGMLLYTVIMSPGYYAQRGDVAFVIFFSFLTILTILSIISTIRIMTKENIK